MVAIPDYTGTLPIEYSLRCSCARRYVIFTGNGLLISDAIGRAKERAEQMNAAFIDARSTPFMNCDCGEVLDFTNESAALLM